MPINSLAVALNPTRFYAFADLATFGERLKEIRAKRFPLQGDFATALGLPQSSVSAWETDRHKLPDTANLIRIAKVLEVSVEELLVGVDAGYDQLRQTSTGDSLLREGERVEGFDVRDGYQPDDLPVITEGEGSPRPEIFWDHAGQLLTTVTERISRPAGLTDRRAYGVKVKGDSMVPAIRPGHYLVVSPAAPITDGDEVFVVLKSGAHLIKFAKKIDGGWLLESANQLHESRLVKKSEIESIHAIVWIRRKRPGLRTIDEATGRRVPDSATNDESNFPADFAKLGAAEQEKVLQFIQRVRADKPKTRKR